MLQLFETGADLAAVYRHSYNLYRDFGFEENGEMDEDEIVAVFKL